MQENRPAFRYLYGRGGKETEHAPAPKTFPEANAMFRSVLSFILCCFVALGILMLPAALAQGEESPVPITRSVSVDCPADRYPLKNR